MFGVSNRATSARHLPQHKLIKMSHSTSRTAKWKNSKRKRKMAKGGTTSTTTTRVYERLRSGHLGFSLKATLKTHHGLASTPLMLNSVSILHHNFALYQNIVAPSVGKTFAIHKLTVLTAKKKIRQPHTRITEGWQNSTGLFPKAMLGFLNDLNKVGVKRLGWLKIPFLEKQSFARSLRQMQTESPFVLACRWQSFPLRPHCNHMSTNS